MQIARATFMNPDFTVTELGQVDSNSAIEQFRSYDWSGAVREVRGHDEGGDAGADPAITLTLEKVHLTVATRDAISFDIEACVHKPRKYLGLFSGVQFYEFGAVSSDTASEAIRSFLADSPDLQHAVFAELKRQDA